MSCRTDLTADDKLLERRRVDPNVAGRAEAERAQARAAGEQGIEVGTCKTISFGGTNTTL